jgi:hypothetical protein
MKSMRPPAKITDHGAPSHPDPNIAYHIDWQFRRDAFLWVGVKPSALNFFPFATEMRAWMRRQRQLAFFSEDDRNAPDAYTNPYTYSASTISALFARTFNATHAFGTSTDPLDPLTAEIERIALSNELALYTARLCEVTIKQLLFCTQIPKAWYNGASLGGLLSTDCRACKADGKPRHNISMLGSLAHHFGKCLPIEHCLADHLRIVNRRRNVETAHSDSQLLKLRIAEESRAQLMEESEAIGNDLVHMLEHIGDLETAMGNELHFHALRIHGRAK